MAQLCQESERLEKLEVEVLVIGPEKPAAFARYWQKQNMPFVGLPDPNHQVMNLYGQEVKLFKLGRMPAQILIDKSGMIRFAYYGSNMADIPGVDEVEEALR